MELLNGVINVTGVSYLIFSIMIIVALGYLLGRVTVKGVSLGTAGVFVISLLYGAFFYTKLTDALKTAEIAQHGLKIVENLGLVFFVTSVGFIAGPKFFKNLKNNFKSYILLGVTIILAGGLTSTPALGTLIHVAKTEDVASAYAATYPIALLAVVLVSQFMIVIFA